MFCFDFVVVCFCVVLLFCFVLRKKEKCSMKDRHEPFSKSKEMELLLEVTRGRKYLE